MEEELRRRLGCPNFQKQPCNRKVTTTWMQCFISTTSNAENDDDDDVDDVVVWVGSRRHVDAMLLFLEFR